MEFIYTSTKCGEVDMKLNLDLSKLLGEYDFQPTWMGNDTADDPFTVRV